MLNEGMSIADAMALRKDDEGVFGGNGMWVFFLFFLLAWGNGGFGGFGNAAGQGALTRAEMYDGFNAQDIKDGIRGVQNGLCDGFYSLNTTLLQGFNGVDNGLCQGFHSVNSAIANLGYQTQNCCYNNGFMAA